VQVYIYIYSLHLVLTAEYLFSMICNSKKVYLKDEILVWSARFILERFI